MPFPPAARESSVSLLLEEVGGGSKERVPAMITLFAANRQALSPIALGNVQPRNGGNRSSRHSSLRSWNPKMGWLRDKIKTDPGAGINALRRLFLIEAEADALRCTTSPGTTPSNVDAV
jgi:hypothetical protein